MNRPIRPRRNARNTNVMRVVTRKIKQLELNHAPKWLRSRSINQDPSAYNAMVPVSRKLRFIGTTSTLATLDLSTAQISAALVNDTGFTIERIKVYGPGSSAMLQATFDQINLSSAQTFDDYGTPGHQRQCIDVFFPRTGLVPISGSGSNNQRIRMDLLDNSGSRVAGDIIVDLWVTVNWNIPVSGIIPL